MVSIWWFKKKSLSYLVLHVLLSHKQARSGIEQSSRHTKVVFISNLMYMYGRLFRTKYKLTNIHTRKFSNRSFSLSIHVFDLNKHIMLTLKDVIYWWCQVDHGRRFHVLTRKWPQRNLKQYRVGCRYSTALQIRIWHKPRTCRFIHILYRCVKIVLLQAHQVCKVRVSEPSDQLVHIRSNKQNGEARAWAAKRV